MRAWRRPAPFTLGGTLFQAPLTPSCPLPPARLLPTRLLRCAVVDLTCVLERGGSYEEIMGELKRASQEELKGILG